MLFSRASFGKRRQQAYRVNLLSWSVRYGQFPHSLLRQERLEEWPRGGLGVGWGAHLGLKLVSVRRDLRLAPIRRLIASDNLGV